MKWQEVLREHKVQRTMHTIEGELLSLIFSLDKRRRRTNRISGNVMYFCFEPHLRETQKDSLARAMKKRKSLTVYRKISPDNWINAGLHRIEKCYHGEDSLGRDAFVVVVIEVIGTKNEKELLRILVEFNKQGTCGDKRKKKEIREQMGIDRKAWGRLIKRSSIKCYLEEHNIMVQRDYIELGSP